MISIDYDSQPVADLLDQLLANKTNTKLASGKVKRLLLYV